MPRGNGQPFRGGAWGFRRAPSFPEGYPYGLMLSYAKTASRAYLPSALERRSLGKNKQPFWWVFDYDLQSQASDDDAIAPTANFVALSMMSTSSQAAGFRTQFRQMADNKGLGFNFSRVPVDNANLFGTAQYPAFLKHPYPMPNHLSLLNRTANKAAAENVIQIAIFGVRDKRYS